MLPARVTLPIDSLPFLEQFLMRNNFPSYPYTAYLDSTNIDGYKPIHIAVMQGNLAAVHALREYHFRLEVNAPRKGDGKTPIAIAADMGQIEVVKALLLFPGIDTKNICSPDDKNYAIISALLSGSSAKPILSLFPHFGKGVIQEADMSIEQDETIKAVRSAADSLENFMMKMQSGNNEDNSLRHFQESFRECFNVIKTYILNGLEKKLSENFPVLAQESPDINPETVWVKYLRNHGAEAASRGFNEIEESYHQLMSVRELYVQERESLYKVATSEVIAGSLQATHVAVMEAYENTYTACLAIERVRFWCDQLNQWFGTSERHAKWLEFSVSLKKQLLLEQEKIVQAIPAHIEANISHIQEALLFLQDKMRTQNERSEASHHTLVALIQRQLQEMEDYLRMAVFTLSIGAVPELLSAQQNLIESQIEETLRNISLSLEIPLDWSGEEVYSPITKLSDFLSTVDLEGAAATTLSSHVKYAILMFARKNLQENLFGLIEPIEKEFEEIQKCLSFDNQSSEALIEIIENAIYSTQEAVQSSQEKFAKAQAKEVTAERVARITQITHLSTSPDTPLPSEAESLIRTALKEKEKAQAILGGSAENAFWETVRLRRLSIMQSIAVIDAGLLSPVGRENIPQFISDCLAQKTANLACCSEWEDARSYAEWSVETILNQVSQYFEAGVEEFFKGAAKAETLSDWERLQEATINMVPAYQKEMSECLEMDFATAELPKELKPLAEAAIDEITFAFKRIFRMNYSVQRARSHRAI